MTWSEIVAETILQIVVGIGFVGLGSILRRYQQRVIDQSNEELRLTELIRDKDSLINTVAHELRTPLTAVLGFTAEMGTEQELGFTPDELRSLSRDRRYPESQAGQDRRQPGRRRTFRGQ